MTRPLIAVAALLGFTTAAHAQNPRPAAASAPKQSSSIGGDIFGAVGATWPAAKDSFEAVALTPTPIDFGGGGRVTGLWGGLFVQGSINHWRDTGERAFIDADGNVFHLGIPLHVNATFFDATLGIRVPLSRARNPYAVYVGGGAGAVRYQEDSPFAESGEDVKLTKLSYHGLAGLEIPVVQQLGAFVEARYRYTQDLLGAGGVSAVFGEDSFGGFNAAVGLRFGFGGRFSVPHTAAATASTPESTTPKQLPPGTQAVGENAVISEAAPVYVLPDASRTPLRTLDAGTRIRLLQQRGDWDQIEFSDPQWGPRVGWVQRRFVRPIDK